MSKIGICLGGNVSERSFLLNPPFGICVPVEYYENYEVALKLILNGSLLVDYLF